MNAIEMIKERRSVRKYTADTVTRDTMKEIVEIARWAPSWANFQIARYTLIDDSALIKKMATDAVKGFTYNIKTLENATGVAVLSFVKGKSGKLDPKKGSSSSKNTSEWESFDAGIACQTFCLAAHAKGVGTCIFGVIDDESISEIIDLPEGESVGALIVYGYEDGEHVAPTPRMETDDILRFL